MKRTILLLFTIVILIIYNSHAQVITFNRFENNPIITPELLPGKDGENINGPSLIKVPDWLPDKLGKYYLYFAHHNGTYIRLAYADDLKGPWKIYEPGTAPKRFICPKSISPEIGKIGNRPSRSS